MRRDTVADLVAYLLTLPQDTDVEVVHSYVSGWDTYAAAVELDLSKSSFYDYDEHAKILTLGECD